MKLCGVHVYQEGPRVRTKGGGPLCLARVVTPTVLGQASDLRHLRIGVRVRRVFFRKAKKKKTISMRASLVHTRGCSHTRGGEL